MKAQELTRQEFKFVIKGLMITGALELFLIGYLIFKFVLPTIK